MKLGVRIASMAAVVLLPFAIFLIGMRRKWPPVVDAVRRLNKQVLNPIQMRSAGTPGAYAAIIHHTGRNSGRAYETPVGPIRADDEFLIGLPYGTRPDWVKNVLAAGHAVIDHEGERHRVIDPEIVPMSEVVEAFPTSDRRGQQVFAVDQCLRMSIAPDSYA